MLLLLQAISASHQKLMLIPCPFMLHCRLVLVDASALMYRMHFGHSSDMRLSSKGGEDTTIVYGFLNTVINLLMLTPPPTHFAVAFDSGTTFRQGGKSFRQEASVAAYLTSDQVHLPSSHSVVWAICIAIITATVLPWHAYDRSVRINFAC